MSATDDHDVVSTVASSRSSLEISTIKGTEKVAPGERNAGEKDDNLEAGVKTPDYDEKISHTVSVGPLSPVTSGLDDNAGLDHMASFMADSPSHEGAMFRRFDQVNLRNLLEMEREIARLEERVWRLEGKRGMKGEEVAECRKALRERIKEYYEAVLLTKDILSLGKPSHRALSHARRTFAPEFGQSAIVMDKFHNPRTAADLGVLAAPSEVDRVTRWLERLSDGADVAHVVTFVTALCAVFFLVGAIVGLYFVSGMRARLGLVAMFTVLFAVAVAGATGARRHDVFVATAAYAAVLVVFVSGNIAADPVPTVCILSGANGNAAAVNSATAPAVQTVDEGVTIVATAVQTVTRLESLGSAVSTVIQTITSAPTVVVQKGEMSDFAKTGIGVGAAVGALFCIMVIGGAGAWVVRKRRESEGKWSMAGWRSERKWFGRRAVGAGSEGRRADRKADRNTGRVGEEIGGAKGKEKEKIKERVRTEGGGVVWV